MRVLVFLSTVLLAASCAPATGSSPQADVTSTAGLPVSAEGYLDKVTVGYQGWFAAPGDGSSMGEWVHWSRSAAPAPGGVTVELYPDTREYEAADLFGTSLGALRDGRPAQLFSSHSERVVDLHFSWMAQAGLDGVGLQRFIATLVDPRHKAFRDDVTRSVRAAAERHGRVFYIEYDISGARDADWVEQLERDWEQTMEGQLRVTDSAQYLRNGGKPVVAIWGFGFPDRPGAPAQSVAVIEWFKARGCFVVGGVPSGFRTGGGTKPGFLDVYGHLDVVQPWSVGSFATEAEAASQVQTVATADRQWAAARGLGYQRVMFPGFAWSNWNGGARNMIPRRAGRFFWAQAVAAAQARMSTFIAMFDEYDEGTAIAKAAEDSSMTPASQYFLTLDADGTRVSSDFYLRLAGAATRMLKGETAVVHEVPVPPFPGGQPPTNPAPATSVPKQLAAADVPVRTFAGPQAQAVMQRLYRAILGRNADPSGLGAYVPLVKSGHLLAVTSALATSPEFDARRGQLGTPSDWSAELYRTLLDREPDAGGLAATAQLVAAQQAAERIGEMVLSPEYASKNP